MECKLLSFEYFNNVLISEVNHFYLRNNSYLCMLKIIKM